MSSSFYFFSLTLPLATAESNSFIKFSEDKFFDLLKCTSNVVRIALLYMKFTLPQADQAFSVFGAHDTLSNDFVLMQWLYSGRRRVIIIYLHIFIIMCWHSDIVSF